MLYVARVVMASGVANQNAELMSKDQSLRVSNAQTNALWSTFYLGERVGLLWKYKELYTTQLESIDAKLLLP